MTTTPTPTPRPEQQVAVRTWRPKTAGILNIIAGVIGLIIGIVVAALGGLIGALGAMFGFGILGAPPIAAGVIVVILGIIAIVGGIYSFRRKLWGLALAGSILALILVWFLGIPSIIFVAQAKKEFA